MRRSRLSVLALALGSLSSCAPRVGAQAPLPGGGLAGLEAEIARLASLAGGTVGVAAVHLETGRTAYLNRGERFPMASTYKVPIAVRLLDLVDRGVVRLDSLIALAPWDLHPGSGTLTELFDDPGVILSLRNLLELMLLISDNSATDVVLRVAGGAAAVSAMMREAGLADIRVDRPTVQLIADYVGVPLPADETAFRMPWFRARVDSVSREARDSAAAAFQLDPRDTATPEAMAELLRRIWAKELLSGPSSELLVDIMRRSTTGAARLRGMLTPDAEVAHKTGTIGGTTNDVGIVRLPGDAGHVVTVVFVKGSTLPGEQRERAIAHVARAAHDYFLFNPVRP